MLNSITVTGEAADNPVRRQRLYVVLIIAVFSTAAAGLVTYALRGNINLFYLASGSRCR